MTDHKERRLKVAKGRTIYREERKVCGDYMFVHVYPVFPAGEYITSGGKRRTRYKPTSEMQAKLNERYSAERGKEIIHANFCGDDYCLHLTYSDEYLPATDVQFKRDQDAFIKRLRRFYSAAGMEFKYFLAPAAGEENDRRHIHILLPGGVDRTELEKLWKYGTANCDRLQFCETGICDLSQYIAGNQKRISFRRWRCSRNMKKPAEKPRRDHVYNRKTALEVADSPYTSRHINELYPGYTLSEAPFMVENPMNGGIYLRMMLYKDDADFMRRRRGMGKYRGMREGMREAAFRGELHGQVHMSTGVDDTGEWS